MTEIDVRNAPTFFRTLLEQGQVQSEQFGYEDLRAQALRSVPLERLHALTVEALRRHQKAVKVNPLTDLSESEVYEYSFLTELTSWFKSEFFQWVDSPDCENCGSSSKFKKRVRVRWVEGRKPWSGVRPLEKSYIIDVEEHECKTCLHVTKFPRHTDCAILLETRKGRCAEWAYVFTLMCRALNYQVRLVYDVTDHVWTEVYSQAQRRWMMIDSCEAIVDQPLLYEKGWGKKLYYVVGVGPQGPQDVSWRYSADHAAMRKRRNSVADKMLLNEIVTRRNLLLMGKPRLYKLSLLKMVIDELAELMVEPVATGEYGGRTSGDAAWIRSRSEDGGLASVRTGTIILIAREKASGRIKLSYSSAADQYCIEETKSTIHKSWTALVFKADNIIRKEENDWKMAYLARQDARFPGVIEWRLEAPTTKIESVEINPGPMVKENCTIIWELETHDDNSNIGKMTNVDSCFVKLLNPCRSLTIRATLSSPENSPAISWQHTQLFRESTLNKEGSRNFGFVFTTSNQ